MIIGIDVGTKNAGIAILNDAGELSYSKQLRFTGSLNKRLGELYRAVWRTVGVDDAVFIERPPYVQNARTHAVLHQAVGTVLAALAFSDAVRELTPAEIKAAFTGNGKATKAQVQQVVKMQFGIDAGEDEADAIATAWAGYCKLREEALDADE